MPAAGNSGGKGANIRDLFCTTPKVLKLHGSYFGINKNTEAQESTRGGHTLPRGWGRPYPLRGPPASWAPWVALRCPSSAI